MISSYNIIFCRIVRDCKYINSDCDDDGEFGAGSRLLHLLNVTTYFLQQSNNRIRKFKSQKI